MQNLFSHAAILIFLLGGLCFQVHAEVSFEKASGTLPRDLTGGEFSIDLVVGGMDPKLGKSAKYSHKLEIYVKSDNNNNFLPFKNFDPAKNRSYVNFEVADVTETTKTDERQRFFVVANLRVVETQKGALKALAVATDRKIEIRIVSRENDQKVETAYTLTADNTIAAEAPDDVTVTGGHRKLVFSWTIADEIRYSDGSDRAPGAVKLYALKADQGTIDVTGLVFNSNAVEDTEEVDCTIDTNAADGEDCVVCTSSDDSQVIYLRDTSVTEQGANLAIVAHESGKASILGFDKEEDRVEHIAFASYKPDGSVRSACYRATPGENQTFTEYMDSSKDAKQEDPNCFIASAVYESNDAPEVKALREFRNRYLLTSTAGRLIVASYYQYGPKVAKWLENKPLLKRIIRFSLDGVVALSAHL